jgi:hypothetical protein
MMLRQLVLAPALLPALLACAAEPALAAEPPCVSPGEFTALASYALPAAIGGVIRRCAPALPDGSFLATQGPALVQRYAAEKPLAWPGAKAAALKIALGANPQAAGMARLMTDDQLQSIADTAIAAKVGEAMTPDRCMAADQLLHLLSPLPPASTAEIIALAVGLGSKAGEAKFGVVRVCPAAVPPPGDPAAPLPPPENPR